MRRTFFVCVALMLGCHVESLNTPPAMQPVATEGPNTLVVSLNLGALPPCAGGWEAVVFGPGGVELSQRSGTVRLETDEGWRGYAAVGARCGTDWHRWGQGMLGRTAGDGGVSVRFRGRDTTGVTRFCVDPWAPPAWGTVVRPLVGLVTTNEGRCP